MIVEASAESDVIIAGGGANALVCALVLVRAGLTVKMVEDLPAVGGVHRSEYPFARAPRLATFTGVHRIGFVPPNLEAHLGLRLPLAARDPAFFIPSIEPGRHVLGRDGLRDAEGLDARDTEALAALHAELDAFVRDLQPSWTLPPMPVEDVAERFVRAERRDAFVRLCRGSFAEYAARFGIQSSLLKGALAADALGGSFASWDAPGSGAPLLVRHAARSRTGGGDAVAVGGLGALARTLAEAAQAGGAELITGSVGQIVVDGNNATGVILADGTLLRAGAVVTSSDPWRLRALVGAERLPVEYMRRIDGFARKGGITKLNVAFSALPRFACLPEDRGQHRATTFLLPQVDTIRALGRAFADATAGRLPLETSIECIFPSAGDAGLRDADGRHSASLLVPWTPYDLAGTTWSAEEESFTSALLDTLESFAPGARALVTDTVLWHPKKLESHFGVMRGHLGHIDETMLFGDRLAPTTPIRGLYACGEGCAPAGGIFGVAGLAAARQVVSDFELALERTEVGVYG